MPDSKGKRTRSTRRPRRMPVMSPGTCNEIIAGIRAGVSLAHAARLAGVLPNTANRHKARDEEFRQRVEQAEAIAESSAVDTIMRNTERSWHAAAWLLERRFPESWARPEVRAQMQDREIDVDELVTRMHGVMKAVALQHADMQQPDVEDTPVGSTFAQFSARAKRNNSVLLGASAHNDLEDDDDD